MPIIGHFVGFVYTCYGIAFTFLDYPMERRLMTFKQKNRAILSRKALILGFGTGCFVVGMVPFSNFFLLPVFVVAGTLLYRREIYSKEEPLIMRDAS